MPKSRQSSLSTKCALSCTSRARPSTSGGRPAKGRSASSCPTVSCVCAAPTSTLGWTSTRRRRHERRRLLRKVVLQGPVLEDRGLQGQEEDNVLRKVGRGRPTVQGTLRQLGVGGQLPLRSHVCCSKGRTVRHRHGAAGLEATQGAAGRFLVP